MKLLQSQIEAEADKWNEPQNEIVKVIKTSLNYRKMNRNLIFNFR
jgi:hypothetical protein